MARSATFGSWVGLGRETVLGTTVARTIFVNPDSESIKLVQPYSFPDALRSPSHPRGLRTAGRHSRGSIMFGASYSGLETFLKDLFGAVTTTTLASTAKQHDFALATDVPSPGLSLEVRRGTGITESFLYADAKVSKGTFRWKPTEETKWEFEMVAREETTPTASVPTIATFRPMAPPVAVLTIDTVSTDLDDLEIIIDNGLQVAPSILNLAGREPLRATMRKVTGSFNLDFSTVAASSIYDKFKSGASAALVIQQTGDVAVGADVFTSRFEMTKIYYPGETPSVDGVGLLKQRVPFQATQTSVDGNDEITARLINTTATVT